MEDYKEKIRKLILKYYSPIETQGEKEYKTTIEILNMCKGVIPSEPITEHDIYEVMEALFFKIEKKLLNDWELFFWVLYEK